MKQIISILAIALGAAFACTNGDKSDSETSASNASTKTPTKMQNLISIVEIPTDSIQRATQFYESILDVSIQQIDLQGTLMGIFPATENGVNTTLIQGSDYKPSDRGTLVYLNGGKDLQKVLDKIEVNGGKIVVPKTQIDSENGFFATFIDSEGNKMGLHSFH